MISKTNLGAGVSRWQRQDAMFHTHTDAHTPSPDVLQVLAVLELISCLNIIS